MQTYMNAMARLIGKANSCSPSPRQVDYSLTLASCQKRETF